MAEYINNDEAADIAETIIPEWHPHLEGIKIAHLSKLKAAPKKEKKAEAKPSRAGKKITMAKTSKLSDRIRTLLAAGVDYRFLIEYDDAIWQELPHEKRVALVDHELAHCGNDIDGVYIKHHGLEEFAEIIQRHGPWLKDREQFLEACDQSFHEAKAAGGQ